MNEFINSTAFVGIDSTISKQLLFFLLKTQPAQMSITGLTN